MSNTTNAKRKLRDQKMKESRGLPYARKLSIGSPTDFQHVQHVGFSGVIIPEFDQHSLPSRSTQSEKPWQPDATDSHDDAKHDQHDIKGYQYDTTCNHHDDVSDHQYTSPVSPMQRKKVLIGSPTNFRHVQHAGSSGFALANGHDQYSTQQQSQTAFSALTDKEDIPCETPLDIKDNRNDVRHQKQKNKKHKNAGLSSSVEKKKAMIGPPTNFHHVKHVGFNSATSTAEQEDFTYQQSSETGSHARSATDDMQPPEAKNDNMNLQYDINMASPPSTHTKQNADGHPSNLVSIQQLGFGSMTLSTGCHKQNVNAEALTADLTSQQVVLNELDCDSKSERMRKRDSEPRTSNTLPRAQSSTHTSSGLRKDMIGPPTNFRHVLHVNSDSTEDRDIQLLLGWLGKVDFSTTTDNVSSNK